MKKNFIALILSLVVLSSCHQIKFSDVMINLNSSAVPVFTFSCSTSIWSFSDNLFDSQLKHSDGKDFPLTGAIKVDEKVYRFMGTAQQDTLLTSDSLHPSVNNKIFFTDTAIQQSVKISATQTSYLFTCGGVDLHLNFTSPLLLQVSDLFPYPINFISYSIQTNDGKPHHVQLFFEAAEACCPEDIPGVVVSESFEYNKLVFMRSEKQVDGISGKHRSDDILNKKGSFYLISEKEQTNYSIGSSTKLRSEFVSNQMLEHVIKGENKHSSLALIKNHGRIFRSSGNVMMVCNIHDLNIGTDKKFHSSGYKKHNWDILSQYDDAFNNYKTIVRKCKRFDNQLVVDATHSGCEKYAALCAMAYRYALSFIHQQTTIESVYLSSPLFLYFNVDVLKYVLQPHLLKAGEVLNKGELLSKDDIATLLILSCAIVEVEGDAQFALKNWDVLHACVENLLRKENSVAHQNNANDCLAYFKGNSSIKTTIGIASFARLAKHAEKNALAEHYQHQAEVLANAFISRHILLEPDTWKNNTLGVHHLVWNKLLNLQIFPKDINEQVLKLYNCDKVNKDQLILNNELFADADKMLWIAALSDDNDYFCSYVNLITDSISEYSKNNAENKNYISTMGNCMQLNSRCPAGGYFIRLLENKIKMCL